MESLHNEIPHWDLEPGRAALPRRPNFNRDERSDVPVREHSAPPFVPRWTRATEKWDARQRIPTRKEWFMERLHDEIVHW